MRAFGRLRRTVAAPRRRSSRPWGATRWALAALLLVAGAVDVPSATPFVRGDANTDGKADLSDAVTILSYLFLGGAVSAPLDALDADDSGEVDISDAISLLGFLFLGAPPPPQPFPAPAFDTTPFDRFLDGDASEYDLLILAPQAFMADLSPLAAHKSSTGVYTVVRSLEEIYADTMASNGRDPPEMVKILLYFLYRRYHLKHVLLVGDADRFPVRYGRLWDSVHYGHRFFPTDLYYADVHDGRDGNVWDLDTDTFCDWDQNENGYFCETGARDHDAADWWELNTDHVDLKPDLAVGRIPASSSEEVRRMVRKIIRYELEATVPWTSRVLLVTGNTVGSNTDATRIASLMEAVGFSSTRHYYTTEWPRIPDPYDRAELINSELAAGHGLVAYLGHGAPKEWTGWYLAADVPRAGNGGKLPIVLAAACGTALFHFEESRYRTFTGSLYSELLCAPEDDALFGADATFQTERVPGDPAGAVRLRTVNLDPPRSVGRVGADLFVEEGGGEPFLLTSPLASADAIRELWGSFRSHNYSERYLRHQFLGGTLTELSSELDLQDATFRFVPGLAHPEQPEMVSLESWNYPGWYLVEETGLLVLREGGSCSRAFDEAATFRMRPGLADPAGVTFESTIRPGHHVRHWNFTLYVEAGSGALYEADATFHLEPPAHDPVSSYRSLRVPGSSLYARQELLPIGYAWSVGTIATEADALAATFRKLAGLARPDDPDSLSLEATVTYGGGAVRKSFARMYVRHRDYRLRVTALRPLRLRDLPEPAPVQTEDVDVDSMAEELTVKHDVGAIAYIGSYTATQSASHRLLECFFAELAARGGRAVLGDVWVAAIRRYVVEEFPAIESRWGDWYATAIYEHIHKMMLFGDPSLRIGGIQP